MKDWDVFDNIIYYPPSSGGGGGGGGEIPQEVLDDLYGHIGNTKLHLTQEMLDRLKTTVTDKDIAITMDSPFTAGIQEGTEFLYTNKGLASNLTIFISLDSVLTTNVIVAVQYLDGSTWKDLAISQLQVGQKQASTTINNILLDNQRIRVVIRDGNLEGIKSLGIIVKVNNPASGV